MSALLIRARQRMPVVSGVLTLTIALFWGTDQALRVGIHWAEVVWLVVVAGAIALLTLPIVLPATLLLDGAVRALRVRAAGRYLVYASVFIAIGAATAFALEVVSVLAAITGGLATGLILAKLLDGSGNSDTAALNARGDS